MRKLRSMISLSMIVLSTASTLVPANACQTYSAAEIAAAIRNSGAANSTLKNASCEFGGAALAESGGNSCSSNGNNFGVLQLTRSNLPRGMTPSQYLNMSLQDQVDTWASAVGNSNTSGGYQTLVSAGSIGGKPVTSGMLAACFQFGPGICKNDIAFMQASGGNCPTAGSGGIRATVATLKNGSANLDGNNQSICSWGGAIQNKINQNAASCKGQTVAGTGTPATKSCADGANTAATITTQTATAANLPAPAGTDAVVGSQQL